MAILDTCRPVQSPDDRPRPSGGKSHSALGPMLPLLFESAPVQRNMIGEPNPAGLFPAARNKREIHPDDVFGNTREWSIHSWPDYARQTVKMPPCPYLASLILP